MALHTGAIVLTDEIKLPARDARDVFAACNPYFDLAGKDLVALREDLSSVRGGDLIQRLELSIRRARGSEYQVQLVSGHLGSGKSTELRWLARELQTSKDGGVFHVVFIDLEEYLDIRDVQLPEFITAIFEAIVDDPVLAMQANASMTAKKIWKDIVTWVKAIGLSLDAEIPVGMAKLKLSLKTSPGLQKRYREVSRDRITWLIQGLGDLIQEVRSALVNTGVDDLVVIADKLDRTERLPLDDGTKRTTHDLFFLEQLPLIQNLPAHLVTTIPVSLHFTQGRLRHLFHGITDVVLPMVTVRKRGPDTDIPDEAGVAALRKLLARRIDCSVVFSDEDALRHAIIQSGGCLRELLRIVSTGTLTKPALGLTRVDVDDVVKELVRSMERLLQGRRFLPGLHHIVKTGLFPSDIDGETCQWLLYELVVLEYNGETWYDVHPFARRTRAFIEAGKALSPA